MIDHNFLALLLGLPAVAGLNPYATMLVLGVLVRTGLADGAIATPAFAVFGQPVFLAIAGTLYLLTLLSERIPLVDHVSDAVHFLVKPLAGALIAFVLADSVSGDVPLPVLALAAAFGGGAISLVVHTTKAASRIAVNVSTVGVGAPFFAVLDDAAAFGVAGLLVLHPVLGVTLLLLVLLLGGVVVRKIIRAFGKRRKSG